MKKTTNPKKPRRPRLDRLSDLSIQAAVNRAIGTLVNHPEIGASTHSAGFHAFSVAKDKDGNREAIQVFVTTRRYSDARMAADQLSGGLL